MGSLIILFKCQSLKSLELLWSDYLSGHLDKMAEWYLVTDEVKEKLNLETIRVKTTIEEENYLNCRKVLLECSGEYRENLSLFEQVKKYYNNYYYNVMGVAGNFVCVYKNYMVHASGNANLT